MKFLYSRSCTRGLLLPSVVVTVFSLIYFINISWTAKCRTEQPALVMGENSRVVASSKSGGSNGNALSNKLWFNNTYFIALKRDHARVHHVENLTRYHFRGAKITWAIDGMTDVPDSQIHDWQSAGMLSYKLGGIMDPKKPTGKPKIACLMSHVRLWRLLAQQPDESTFYLIMEDDVIPAFDFDLRYPAVINELQDLHWDWVYLAIHPTWRHGNKRTIRGKKYINKSPRMVGNAAYLVSRRGARKILEGIFPVAVPKDQAIRKMVQRGDLNAYIVKTELVHVVGQQGEGFEGQDKSRVFKSNIWTH